MEKEIKDLKVILNIFHKFLEKNKCEVAVFGVDAYDLKISSGYKFYCGSQYISSPIPLDRYIEDFMDVLKGNDELDTWVDTPDGGDTEIYAYNFEINPEERMVRIYGDYSYYAEGELEKNYYDTDELPEEVIGFLNTLSEEGHGELEVDFQGSGDSGWVEEDGRTRKDDNYKIPDVVENYCYELLNKYPGWEINEGSQGKFYFDSSKIMVSFEFQYNEEISDRELFYQFKY
jgi:hypothetical protein